MAIAEQFAGTDMEQLIGAPLLAVVDAQLQLANAAAGFIRQAGVDENGKTRTAGFTFWQAQTGSGESVGGGEHPPGQEVRVDVPLLALVPVPNLQIDEVGLTFDMEVRQSGRSESDRDIGGTLDGGAGFGPAKLSIKGTVSSHSHHTRESDYSAKYHIDIRASNHGTPEALARVRDLMLSGLAPDTANSVAEKEYLAEGG